MIFLLMVIGKVRLLARHSLALMRTAEGTEPSKLGQELRRFGARETSMRAYLQGGGGRDKAELQTASLPNSMMPPPTDQWIKVKFNMAPPDTKPGKSREGESRG